MSSRPAPAIHFGIPFYSGLEYLRETIASVLAQSLDDWELCVHDDSATNEAESLLAEFDDPRLSYTPNPPPAGMVPNWNRCLNGARSALVTILHGDDRLLPNYAEHMVALAREHQGAAAFFAGARIIDAGGSPTHSFVDGIKDRFVPSREPVFELSGESAVSALLRGNFIMCPTMCYRLPGIGERRFEERWKQVQDLAFTTGLLMDGEQLVGTREELYEYRRHAENATVVQSTSLLRYREEYALYDELGKRLDALGWRDAARISRARRILKLHLGYDICADLVRLRIGDAARRMGFLLRPRTAGAGQMNSSK